MTTNNRRRRNTGAYQPSDAAANHEEIGEPDPWDIVSTLDEVTVYGMVIKPSLLPAMHNSRSGKHAGYGNRIILPAPLRDRFVFETADLILETKAGNDRYRKVVFTLPMRTGVAGGQAGCLYGLSIIRFAGSVMNYKSHIYSSLSPSRTTEIETITDYRDDELWLLRLVTSHDQLKFFRSLYSRVTADTRIRSSMPML